MGKTLLCKTTQLNNAQTPSFQIPGSHPLSLKPWLLYTSAASTLPRPAKAANTLCHFLPRPVPRPPPHIYLPATHTYLPATHTQHVRAVTPVLSHLDEAEEWLISRIRQARHEATVIRQARNEATVIRQARHEARQARYEATVILIGKEDPKGSKNLTWPS